MLTAYPMPYRAIGWMVAQAAEGFTGNARIHYQHLADRVRGERAELKRWRAWAAWAIVRQARPDLPGDPRHAVVEPGVAEIAARLPGLGGDAETAEWRRALADHARSSP